MTTDTAPSALDYLDLVGVQTRSKTLVPMADDGTFGFLVDAVVVVPPAACPVCGGKLHVHDRRTLTVADVPREQAVQLRLLFRRYRCVECRTRCTDLPDGVVAAGRRMTSRLVAYLEARAFAVPVVRLATETGLAQTTVAGVVDAYLDRLEVAFRPRATTVIGIDEVHLGRAAVGVVGHDRKRGLLVITAPAGNRVLAVGRDTKTATLQVALRGLADLDQVRIVTMDMTSHYRDVVRSTVSWATIIADRWHVQRLFVEAAQVARKRFSRTAPAAERPRLQAQHTLVGKRRWDLAAGERRQLDGLLAAAPLLAEAYRLKEGFCAIYDRCRTSSAAIDAYDAWLRSFPQPDDDPDSAQSRLARDVVALFADAIKAVESWAVEVFGWFDAPAVDGVRPSQGHAENRNRWLKRLYADGNGVSHDTLHRRAVYACEPGYLVPRDAADRARVAAALEMRRKQRADAARTAKERAAERKARREARAEDACGWPVGGVTGHANAPIAAAVGGPAGAGVDAVVPANDDTVLAVVAA